MTFTQFKTTGSLRKNLRELVSKQKEIFTFKEESLLASLCLCIGLDFEIGNHKFDRLSEILNIDLPSQDTKNGWNSEVIKLGGQIAIRLWNEQVKEFEPTKNGLLAFLHPSSIDSHGKLSQLVICPNEVAEAYEKLGLELVIVRDWALSSSLSEEGQKPVEYVGTSTWEIESHTTRFQTDLMAKQQLAFSGTHDIVDHIMDATLTGFSFYRSTYQKIQDYYRKTFSKKASRIELTLSYLVGVILDDLAQPRWYGSHRHKILLDKSMEFLVEANTFPEDLRAFSLSDSFHRLIHFLRDTEIDFKKNYLSYFNNFCFDLVQQTSVLKRGRQGQIPSRHSAYVV